MGKLSGATIINARDGWRVRIKIGDYSKCIAKGMASLEGATKYLLHYIKAREATHDQKE